MNKKLKIGLVMGNIFLCLMFQSISAFAWMGTEVINDYSEDMVLYDEEFYEKYAIDMDKDPNQDLDTLHEKITEHWYDEKSTVLTPQKLEDYAYVDILDISKEVVDEALVIKVRTRGNVDDEDYWLCFVWNDDMLLLFSKIGNTFRLNDIENEDSYTGKFYDADDQYIIRYEDIDEKAWKGSDIKFISIGMNSDFDIIVDITPNPINWNMIYISVGIVALIIILFSLAVYYKNREL